MHQRFLAVSQMPVAGGLDVRRPHDLGEVFARDIDLLFVHSFKIERHCQVGHQRREGIGQFRKRGEAILAFGDIA